MNDIDLSFLRTHIRSELRPIIHPVLDSSTCTLSILREDMLHPLVSGNKFRKLKYNLLEAKKNKRTTLLTFGGAYSNHIAAVATVGHECGFRTVGVIRGDELADKIDTNPTLLLAKQKGMQFHFVSRSDYKRKTEEAFIETLRGNYGAFYLIPEGGTNEMAVKGCEEILNEQSHGYDYICVAVGTGGTLAGLVKSSLPHQKILGFSSLKGTFQKDEVEKYTNKTNYEIIDDYCFGGYAKIDIHLIRFINTFKEKNGIPLDPIYTGKMIFGIMHLIKNNFFTVNSRILAIHTGGLQGISGMNLKLLKKNLPIITT